MEEESDRFLVLFLMLEMGGYSQSDSEFGFLRFSEGIILEELFENDIFVIGLRFQRFNGGDRLNGRVKDIVKFYFFDFFVDCDLLLL